MQICKVTLDDKKNYSNIILSQYPYSPYKGVFPPPAHLLSMIAKSDGDENYSSFLCDVPHVAYTAIFFQDLPFLLIWCR